MSLFLSMIPLAHPLPIGLCAKLATKVVLESLDIVFSEVGSCLNFDDSQSFFEGIRQSMFRRLGNINILTGRKLMVLAVQSDERFAQNHSP